MFAVIAEPYRNLFLGYRVIGLNHSKNEGPSIKIHRSVVVLAHVAIRLQFLTVLY